MNRRNSSHPESFPPEAAGEVRCSICRHLYQPREITKHHLIPKSRRGKETVPLCRNCHRQVHALFTEKELERSFGTLELLLAAEPLQPWIRWVRRRKPNGRLAVKETRQKRRR